MSFEENCALILWYETEPSLVNTELSPPYSAFDLETWVFKDPLRPLVIRSNLQPGCPAKIKANCCSWRESPLMPEQVREWGWPPLTDLSPRLPQCTCQCPGPRPKVEIWCAQEQRGGEGEMVKTANKDKWRGINPENVWLQLLPLPTSPRISNYDLKSLDTYFIMWII